MGTSRATGRPADVWKLIFVSLTALMVVVAGAGVWRGLYAAPAVEGPAGTIPVPDPARLRPATIESALEGATARARTWEASARLFSVTAQYDYPTTVERRPGEPVGGWLIFVFARGEDKSTETLTLLIERNRAEIVRETTRSLGVSAAGLDPQRIEAAVVDSATALIGAEAEAGLAFRAECFPTRHVARVSFRPGGEGTGAAWVISYNDSRISNGPVLRVVVDAQTGQATVAQLEATEPAVAALTDCPT